MCFIRLQMARIMHGKWNISGNIYGNITSQIISECGTVLMRQAIFTRQFDRHNENNVKKAIAKVQARIDFDRGLSSKSSFLILLFEWKFNLKWMLNWTGNIDSDFVSLSIVCVCVCALSRPFDIPHFQFEFLTFCRIYFLASTHTHIITCFVGSYQFFPHSQINFIFRWCTHFH